MTTIRNESVVETVQIRHIASPMGRERENGPHLDDLRRFVEACIDLPGTLRVYIDNGHLDEGGRMNVTIRTSHRVVRDRDDAPAAGDDT